jgi:hypothetical protein
MDPVFECPEFAHSLHLFFELILKVTKVNFYFIVTTETEINVKHRRFVWPRVGNTSTDRRRHIGFSWPGRCWRRTTPTKNDQEKEKRHSRRRKENLFVGSGRWNSLRENIYKI